MKLKKKKTIIASAMIFGLSVSVANDFYVVKKGDTLSNILFAKKLFPIYGHGGSLAQVLKLNPDIRQGGGNKIFPKMKIVLSNTKSPEKILSSDIKYQTNIRPTNLENDLGEKENIPTSKETTAERLPSDNFKQIFYWELSPILSWKSLSSADENIYQKSKVNALSSTNYGIGIAYGMHFEENIDIYSKLSLESVSFSQDQSINLLQKKFIASRFGVGVAYERKWMLELAMSDEFFLTSPSLSNIAIKKVTLPELKVTYMKDFYQYRNARLSYAVSANAFLPKKSPDVDSTFSYGVGAALEAKLHNQAFQVGYDLNLLKAIGNSTNSQNIYWKYIWETL